MESKFKYVSIFDYFMTLLNNFIESYIPSIFNPAYNIHNNERDNKLSTVDAQFFSI